MRIVPDQPRLKIDAGESRTLDREVRDLFVAKSQVQRHRLESWATLDEVTQPVDVLFGNESQARKAQQRIVEVIHLFRNQLELVGRKVFGQYTPLAIKDQPPDWRHGLDTVVVSLRLGSEDFVVDDLQLHQARDNQPQHQAADNRGQNDPADKEPSLGMNVLDWGNQVQISVPAARAYEFRIRTSTRSAI